MRENHEAKPYQKYFVVNNDDFSEVLLNVCKVYLVIAGSIYL